MNAQLDGAAEVGIANAGAAVQYQRQAGLLANGVQTREIEFRLAFVFAVCVADGDASASMPVESTNSRARCGSVKKASSACPYSAPPSSPHRAQLRLHGDAHRMAHLHHFPRLANIFRSSA
jgi:hypothetical protein